ncbi:MAG: hypothetical protein Q7R49_06120 [Candidatus Daviesbacteria bacterium]|nr:hypothetical protein [Candidatus Daviesbacteria bacterium]
MLSEIINTSLFRVNLTTKSSTQLHTHHDPVNVTLAVAGTAENIWTPDTTLPTINLCTNPSAETGSPPTGYTASGATLAQSATVARTGTYSLRITPDNAAAAEGAYWNIGTIAGFSETNKQVPISISAYFNKNAAAGAENARVRLWGSTSGFITNGNTVTVDATWQRSSISYMIQTNETWRVYVVNVAQAATVFYMDDLLIELQPQVSAYCDGSLGRLYRWDGAANASTSRRKWGMKEVRGYTLYTTRDIYLDFDQTAISTASRFVRAGTDFWSDYPLSVVRNISIINAVTGELPRVYGQLEGVDYSSSEF